MYEGVTAPMEVNQFLFSWTTWATSRFVQLVSATFGNLPSSIISATVKVIMPPCPLRTPLVVMEPGRIMTTLVPKVASCARTAALAPSPILIIAITAPTPMMIPSMVRAERRRFRLSTRNATEMVITRSDNRHLAMRGVWFGSSAVLAALRFNDEYTVTPAAFSRDA